MADLDWVKIEPAERKRLRAVRLTHENAQAVAERFGGTVQVVPGATFFTQLTRLTLGNTSGPARGWITEEGKWLNEHEWTEVD